MNIISQLFSANESSTRGDYYEQLYQVYPILSPLYLQQEKVYQPEIILQCMKDDNYMIPLTSTILYLLFCGIGSYYMKNMKPFKLESSLALWNLGLALFSLYGAIRTVPHLLHRMMYYSFEETVCDPAHVAFGAGACGLATQMFILSKIPELIDTVFIVLRKKPLIFLHWYHHVTVLLYSWNSYVTESAAGIYFVAMNYTVHSVMYFYFYLMITKRLPRTFPSYTITILQISQMICGTIIVSSCLYYYKYGGNKYRPGECHNTESNLIMGGLMYASYLYLFLEFAIKRFVFGNDMQMIKNKKE